MRVATPLTGWRLVATRAASPARVSPAASFGRARSRAGADPGAGWRFEVREISLRRFYLRWHKRHFRARSASEGLRHRRTKTLACASGSDQIGRSHTDALRAGYATCRGGANGLPHSGHTPVT